MDAIILTLVSINIAFTALLATLIVRQGGRLDAVAARIDGRLGSLDARLDALNARIDTVRDR